MYEGERPVPNNTALVADVNNQIGTIFCSSGSRVTNIGHWLAPNQTEITESSSGSFTAIRGGGNFPSYIALQLKSGSSIAEEDQGVYTCIIQDEDGVQQILYVGIYRYSYYGEGVR